MCTSCHSMPDAPAWPAPRQCSRCEAGRPNLQRVYLGFQLSYGWHVHFLEPGLKKTAARGRTFADAEKIRELIRRTPTKMDAAAWQALEYAFEKGRGGLYLTLTEEQYLGLKR